MRTDCRAEKKKPAKKKFSTPTLKPSSNNHHIILNPSTLCLRNFYLEYTPIASSMSSMRNAVQRRQHRERGQLGGREKWGILEKHKVNAL
jgi:hypothetical protein